MFFISWDLTYFWLYLLDFVDLHLNYSIMQDKRCHDVGVGGGIRTSRFFKFCIWGYRPTRQLVTCSTPSYHRGAELSHLQKGRWQQTGGVRCLRRR